MTNLFTYTLECDGDCGAKIELTLRDRRDSGQVHVAAEALGWTTRDRGKKTEVYCVFCQTRAERIVKGT